MSRRITHTTYPTNLSIRPHNPFREVESAMVCCRGLAARIKPMNPEQLWRPIVESSSVERPATHMRKALSLREVELCLFPSSGTLPHRYERENSRGRRSPYVDRWTRLYVSLRGRPDVKRGYGNPTQRQYRCRTGEDGLSGDRGNPNLVHSRRCARRTGQRTRCAPESD